MSATSQRDTTSPATPVRSAWDTAPKILGAIGLVLIALTFPAKGVGEDLATWSALVGFFVVFVAILVWIIGALRARGERVTVLPTTGVGWAALAALAVGVALQFFELAPIGFVLVLAAAVAAIWAMTSRNERSMLVIAPVLLATVFIVAFVFLSVAIGYDSTGTAH